MADGRALRRLLPLLLTAAVLVVLVAFLVEHWQEISDRWSIDPLAFAAVGALTVAVLFARAIANRLHFGGLGVNASSFDWFRIVAVTSFANYLPLSAGLFAKAFFLKRVHEVPYRRFVFGQASLLLVVISTNGVAGLAVLAWCFPAHLLGPVGAGFAAMSAAFGLLLLPARLRRALPRALRWDGRTAAAALRRWPGVALAQLAVLAGAGASLLLCFSMGETRVGYGACLVFSAAAVLTRFVTVVPGALGVREFLIGGLAVLTGFDLANAVVASILTRAAEIVVVFVLGGVFTWSLSGELADSYEEEGPA